MKKLFGLILAALLCLFLGFPAFAHNDHNKTGSGKGSAHGSYNGPHGQVRGGPHGQVRGGRDERGHFDGRHFDADYRGRYFGAGHVFAIGPRYPWGRGFRFFYGGFWFGYYDWPDGWGIYDPVYVDCDEYGDCFLVNPYYSGVHVGLSVVF